MPVIEVGAFDQTLRTRRQAAVVPWYSSASGHRQWQRLVEALQSRYRLLRSTVWSRRMSSGRARDPSLPRTRRSLSHQPNWRSWSPSLAIRSEAQSRLKLRVRFRSRPAFKIRSQPTPFGHLKGTDP